MELVLGLAALATALSSVGAVNHIDDHSNTIEAKPETVQTVNETAHKTDIGQAKAAPSKLTDKTGAISKPLGRIFPDDPFDPNHYTVSESESNNTYDTANEIGNYNYTFSNYSSGQKPNSYSRDASGCIGQDGDVDFYMFTLYGKADVTITLKDIPSQCDYDVRLYEQGTGRYSDAQIRSEIAYSGRGSNSNELIEKFLYPNTYYIKVYSYRGYGSPLYKLTLNVNYQRNDESISVMKAKGAKGALWLSDYDPYGIKPSISDSKTPIGSTGSWSRCDHYPRDWSFGSFDTTHFTFPIQTGVYKHAELFIFEESYRQRILNVVTRLETAVAQEIQGEQEIQIWRDMLSYQWNGIVSICCYIPYAGTVISLLQDAYEFISGAIEIFCPPENMIVTKTNYLAYLHGLKQSLLFYNPDGDSTKVLSIPMRYRVTKKQLQGSTYPAGLIPQGAQGLSTNYFLTYEPANLDDDFVYTDSYIHAQDPENPITGTVYPIVFGGDLNRAMNNRTLRKLNYPELYLDQVKTVDHLYDREYEWFNFTAPHAGTFRIRSTGDTKAAVHVSHEKTENTSAYGDEIIARAYQTSGYDIGFSYDFHLNAGETLWFRVCGTISNYQYLYTTNVTVTEIQESNLASFQADDLPLASSWNNAWWYQTVSGVNGVANVESKGTYSSGDGLVEMQVDSNGICSKSIFRLFFSRPVKSITFGYCIPDGYSYAYLGLYVEAHNQDGDVLATDIIGSYSNDYYEWNENHWMYSYGLQYATSERDVGEGVYAITFSLDPATDQSPYHISYQRAWLCDFNVEYAN